jgi:hypothetical protein
MTRRKARPPKSRLVLIRPSRDPAEIRQLIVECERRAAITGMVVKSYRADSGRLLGEAPERPVLLLKPLDAQQLYEWLHLDRVLIVTFNTVWVRRDPSRDPPTRRAALKLATFAAHKSICGTVLALNDVTALFDRFVTWCGAVACTGDNDPRILPLHVFETSDEWAGLGQPLVDRRFRQRHGSPSRRRADDGNVWTRASQGAYHGGLQLTVAGCGLSRGIHWDVTTNRRKARLFFAHEIWQLNARGGYANVHPSAVVLNTGRTTARRVWSAASNG